MPEEETGRIIVTTGPESSGKTSLATSLASSLNLPLVGEASRDYLNDKRAGNPDFLYKQSDLLHIAKIQLAKEHFNRQGQRSIVCDTDLLVIIIWSEEKFSSVDPWITQTFLEVARSEARHYILCHWDIPWQADPLRENPYDRERLYSLYLKKLQEFQLPFTVVNGNQEQRLAQSLVALD